MKVTSIIFLFISVAFIIGGLFLMKTGRNAAPNDLAIDGYDYSNDGVITSTVALDEEDITKYAIVLNDCSVVITGNAKDCDFLAPGNAKKSTARLTNFKPNRYMSSVSGKTYTLSDDISIMDYISFDGTGVKFSGVWQTLLSVYNSYKYKNDESKEVVIYISSADQLNQININLTNCELSIRGLAGNYDLNVSGTDSKIEIKDIACSTLSVNGNNTEYSLLNNITTNDLDLTLNGGAVVENKTSRIIAENVTAELDGLDAEINIDFRNLIADVKNGDFSLTTNYAIASYSKNIATKSGSLYINRENIGSSFETDKDAVFDGSIVINSETGNIKMNFGSFILLPEIPDADDPDETDETDDDTADTDIAER